MMGYQNTENENKVWDLEIFEKKNDIEKRR